MTQDRPREGSRAPLTIFFIAALFTPYVILQSSFAVFYVTLGHSPRGASPRLAAPVIDIANMILVLLIAGSFLLILTRPARRFGVGWTVPGVATFLVLMGVLLNGLILSIRRHVEDNYAPAAAGPPAHHASDLTFLGGTVLVVTTVLLAPIVARATTGRRRWVKVLYVVLCGGFAVYGIAPLLWVLATYG